MKQNARLVRGERSDVSPAWASASMTGPTSVSSCRGIANAQLRHRALEHADDVVGDVVLQAEHAQRRAALAGGVEGGGQHVANHLLRQRRGVHDHRVLAAGLGDQKRDVAAPGERALLMCARDLGRAGEQHGRARDGRRPARRPRLRRPGSNCSASRGMPASCSRRTGSGGDQRRLLGGLGDNRIAGRQRGRDLAGEDREREIPWADADGGAQGLVRRAQGTGLSRVIAQKSTASRTSEMALGMVLPASRTISSHSRSIDCSSRSAPRSRIAARSEGATRAHSGADETAAATASSMQIALASEA